MRKWDIALLAALGLFTSAPAFAETISGQVLGAGAPIAGSAVTLWAAGAGTPAQLAQSQTDADGRFTLSADAKGADLYVTARGGRATGKTTGDNPAIALLSVIGTSPPDKVVVNEMTTIASVWTHNQFLDGTAVRGPALSLKIAAGNVPNFVDLSTGGWGEAILGPLNSGQTPTMANFATLADALAGCVARVADDACAKLFVGATAPKGAVPTDTLAAAEAIARYPWYLPKRVFALLDEFYPLPRGKTRFRSCLI
jgi:hypothetical protein